MKKTYGLIDLDCANCAAKMERNITKIDGVTSASVNFMMQKLTLEASEADLPRILEDAQKADETFTILMGDKVAPRREFIEKNAKYVTDLDV